MNFTTKIRRKITNIPQLSLYFPNTFPQVIIFENNISTKTFYWPVGWKPKYELSKFERVRNFDVRRRGGKRLVFSRRSSVECSARLTKRWAVDGRVDGASRARGRRAGRRGAGRTWARHVCEPAPASASAPAPQISVIRVHRRNTTYPISMDRLMIMDVSKRLLWKF